jgi:tetratricopeptide (TPR) repeat protein
MRTLLLSSAAGVVLAVAAPAAWVALTPAPDHVNTLAGPLDPLRQAQAICGPGAPEMGQRLAAFLGSAAAYAQTTEADAAAPSTGPLWTGLGTSTMAITTTSEAAQIYFDQGLRLMHGFNHGEAVNSFRQAQALDPECAMCFWGEALALGPNINAAMPPTDYARAHEAAQRAWTLAQANGTDKEKALAQALTYRYEATAPEDRSKLDEAWADAIAEVADRFPEDDEIQAMAAEAIMDMQPWNYWEADQRTPGGRAGEALARLETVLARNPDHAPSIHLYIHMTEASVNPWRAEPYADRLAALAPASGHLVHMPTHTYYVIGRFKESLALNIEAVAADEAILAETEASPVYRFGYYPHNVHMALVSAQMAGDGANALYLAGLLDTALPLEMAATEAWVQPIKAAPWYARAQFELPEDLIAAPLIGAEAPYLLAAQRYARGEALAKLGRASEALDEAAAIGVLRETSDFSALEGGGVPASDVLSIMEIVVRGRAADVQGDLAAAIEAYQAASELQAGLGYFEPPYWWYPVRQSLASALLRDGQASRAEIEFYRTLIESPNNGWAYWGLAQARRAMGDRAGARDAERRWRDAWAGERDALSLERL